jgi:hypothetical protein
LLLSIALHTAGMALARPIARCTSPARIVISERPPKLGREQQGVRGQTGEFCRLASSRPMYYIAIPIAGRPRQSWHAARSRGWVRSLPHGSTGPSSGVLRSSWHNRRFLQSPHPSALFADRATPRKFVSDLRLHVPAGSTMVAPGAGELQSCMSPASGKRGR